MALWKVTEDGPRQVETTRFRDEDLLEEHLEDWIEKHPDLLGESLLIIGRQVTIPDVQDRIDLLAVDAEGNAVVVELKRGALTDPVDVQSLRYASYISKWGFEEFERVASNHRGQDEKEYNFNADLEAFFEDTGIEETPNLNEDQRIIIVGASVREKLGSVALWLNDHNVDIRLIEVTAYKSDGELFVEPSVIVPVPVNRFAGVGKSRPDTTPWRTDGKTWHLEKRCSEDTRKHLLALNELLLDQLDLDVPSWGQKLYVAYRIENRIWLRIITGAQRLRLEFRVETDAFEAKSLADRLGIVEFEKEESLSKKFGLPSSVTMVNRNEATDKVKLWMKEDFNLENETFVEFLREAYEKRQT